MFFLLFLQYLCEKFGKFSNNYNSCYFVFWAALFEIFPSLIHYWKFWEFFNEPIFQSDKKLSGTNHPIPKYIPFSKIFFVFFKIILKLF
jgi:hypothetical protein